VIHAGSTAEARAAAPPSRHDRKRAVERTDVDSLAAHWCAALDAGRASLDAASLYLPDAERGAHTRRLEDDRASAVGLLRGLAHEQHRKGLLVGWLATPRHTKAMLGLPEEIDACVFDLEGVLTTSDVLHAEAWADALDPFLLERTAPDAHVVPFDRLDEYEEHFAGRPRDDGVRSFLGARGLGFGDQTVEKLGTAKAEALERRLEHEGVSAFETSHSYLEAAELLGIRRAVVTASVTTQDLVRRAGLADLIDVTVDGRDMAEAGLRPEPAPDAVLEACRRLDVPPARVAAFETSGAGVRAARDAGVGLVVAVRRDWSASSLRDSRPDAMVRDLGALFAGV